MINMDGQAMNYEEFVNRINELSIFKGFSKWRVTEISTDDIKYDVEGLEFEYIEDEFILIASDYNNYIYENATKLCCIQVEWIKSIQELNDCTYIVSMAEEIVIIKALV